MSAEDRKRLERQLASLLTVQDLVKIFRRTPMASHNWVNSEVDPLPRLPIRGDRRDTLRFIPTEVFAWAQKTGRKTYGGIPRNDRKAA